MKRVSLIKGDSKRLKSYKFVSLQTDLDDLYKHHEDVYTRTGNLPHQMASGTGFTIHKIRMAISNPQRPTSKGVRLWIYFDKVTETYYEVFLFLAVDEDKTGYKSNDCHRIIQERLKDYLH